MTEPSNFLGFAKSTIDLQTYIDPRLQDSALVVYGGFVAFFKWEDGSSKNPDRNPEKNETVTIKNFPSIVKSNFSKNGRWIRNDFNNLTYKPFHKHSQKKPASEWRIKHEMQRTPSVTVIDSADNVVIGNVNYVNDNALDITFSSEFSGTAYLT